MIKIKETSNQILQNNNKHQSVTLFFLDDSGNVLTGKTSSDKTEIYNV